MVNNRRFEIAVDGPSGAGKSTIAKLVAARLGIDYIDTGAMYRAIGYKIAVSDIDPEEGEELEVLLANTDIELDGQAVLLDGKDISAFIRNDKISMMASKCSKLKSVREKLVELQRQMGRKKSIIMDGRDIGTNVLPDAEFKFYLTADAGERARRRYSEYVAAGKEAEYEEVLRDIENRDYEDMNRELNPLRKADDAVLIDSTNMTIEEVADFIVSKVVG